MLAAEVVRRSFRDTSAGLVGEWRGSRARLTQHVERPFGHSPETANVAGNRAADF
jgi:hypothetical protein